MPQNYQIKKYVVFTEFSTVPKEFAENTHFDIYNDNGLTNENYCKVLMSKVLKLPYRLLPDFIAHHTALVSDPIVSLPKNWTNYNPTINDKKQLILGYENK